jgi:hypothetical protein
MSTVVEIERAIEALPTEEMRKLLAWIEEKQVMMAATASMFALYDEEEGEGQQWQD